MVGTRFDCVCDFIDSWPMMINWWATVDEIADAVEPGPYHISSVSIGFGRFFLANTLPGWGECSVCYLL